MKISDYKKLKELKTKDGEPCASIETVQENDEDTKEILTVKYLKYKKYDKNTGELSADETMLINEAALERRKQRLQEEIDAIDLILTDLNLLEV